MRVFRISRPEYIGDLSGYGAALHGGRWNSPGTPVVYTSENASLALLEQLANLHMDFFPTVLAALDIELPDTLVLDIRALDDSLNNVPPASLARALGDQWAHSTRSLALLVPAKVSPLGEQNILLNPRHPNANKIKIIETSTFSPDARLRG